MYGDEERYEATRHQELMLRIARRPAVFCCCICIPRQDRRRARRIFRITRRVIRAWENEQREQAELSAGASSRP
jgi:hypothetical protein